MFNLEVDEYEAVGGIYKEATGEELRVTTSELWGKEMLVPADAEIILEGYITERQEEAGLWCDAWQNYARPSKQNVFRVEALTMRKRPLYVSNWPALSIQTSLSGAAEVYALLKPYFPEIRGINIPFIQTVIVSAKLSARGLGANLAAADPFADLRDHAEPTVGLGLLRAGETHADARPPGGSGELFQAAIEPADDGFRGEVGIDDGAHGGSC